MSSLSTDVTAGAASAALRTSFRVRGLPMAYGYKASCTTQSGGEIYVSTGLQSPIIGFAMVRGSTNSQSIKWGTHSILQWIRGTGSYAVFKCLQNSAQSTWASISYIALNWLVFEA